MKTPKTKKSINSYKYWSVLTIFITNVKIVLRTSLHDNLADSLRVSNAFYGDTDNPQKKVVR